MQIKFTGIKTVALILSGGVGTRLGTKIPKQYIEVCGKRIIHYCLETLSANRRIDAIHIVADVSWQDTIRKCLEAADPEEKFMGFSEPGRTRQLSILNGLTDIRKYAGDLGYVFIHDAARPLLSARLVSDCLDQVTGHDGLMPVVPMKDTVYTSLDGGKSVASLLDRRTIYAGQAPEVFRIGRYYEANRKLLPEKILQINGSTEAAVLDGMDIAMIPGDETNFKITTEEDLERFRKIAEERTAAEG